jgi:hypothetical protein
MKCHWLILTALLLVGCSTRPAATGRTAEQFQFLHAGMSLTDVATGAGKPDRELGYGQIRWEYDLADGSEIVIFPSVHDYSDWSACHVAWFGQRRGTNWLWTLPADYK